MSCQREKHPNFVDDTKKIMRKVIDKIIARKKHWKYWLRVEKRIGNPLSQWRILRSISAVMTVVMLVTTTLQPLTVVAQTHQGESILRLIHAQHREQSLIVSTAKNEKPHVSLENSLMDIESKMRQVVPGYFNTVIQPHVKAALNLASEPLGVESFVKELEEKAPALYRQADEALSQFQQEREILIRQGFSHEMLKRHDGAAETAKTRYEEFRRLTDSVIEADNSTKSVNELQENLKQLARFLDTYISNHAEQYIDPNDLPFQSGHGKKTREPLQTEEALSSYLRSQDQSLTEGIPLERTALKEKEGLKSLGETEEVQLTQAVRDKAGELGKNPVSIYNWVRNNIDFLPTYGSIQNSDTTLLTRQGNAFDIATLLIALMRAAGIEARYVYGSVEIPVEQVMHWLNVNTPEVAQSMLSQGDIPVVALISGGRVQSFRIEHVWTEVYVQYHPHRGSKHQGGVTSADTWVPLDASFKMYQTIAPLNLGSPGAMLDGNALIDRLVDGADINETTGQYLNLNVVALNESVNDTLQNAIAYLSQNYNADELQKALDGKQIVKQELPYLAGSLPYKIKAIGARYDELPTSLRMGVSLRLYANNMDAIYDSPALSVRLSLPKIGMQRFGVSYVAATQSDQSALDSMINNPAVKELSLYLINVRPQIKLDDVVVVEGSGVQMASDQIWEVRLNQPWSSSPMKRFNVSAGGEFVFGINGGVASDTLIAKRYNSTNSATAAENLNMNALHYWWEFNMIASAYAKGMGVAYQLKSGFGLFSAPISVTSSFFGIPRSGYYQGRRIDIPHMMISSEASTLQRLRTFHTWVGMQGSLLENAVAEQLFGYSSGMGVSAVQLLNDAQEQGIPIVVMNPSNVSTALPGIVMSSATRINVMNALNTGKTVIMPQRAPEHLRYDGNGYIILDPVIGVGAYMIEGGMSGGAVPDCICEKIKMPRAQAFELIIKSLIIIMILAAMSAGTGGADTPAKAFELTALLAMFGMTALFFPANAEAAKTPPFCCYNPLSDCEKPVLYRAGGNVNSARLERVRLNRGPGLKDDVNYTLNDSSYAVPTGTTCDTVPIRPDLFDNIIVTAGSGGASHSESRAGLWEVIWFLPRDKTPGGDLCLINDTGKHWVVAPRKHMSFRAYCNLLIGANSMYER